MKKISLFYIVLFTSVIAFTITPAMAIDDDPEIRALRDNFLNKYKNCKTFSCEGRIVSERSQDSDSTRNNDISFSVLYERPYNVWINWTRPKPYAENYDDYFTLYTVPGKGYAIRYRQGLSGHIDRTEQHRTLEDAINRSMRPSYDLTKLILGLLKGSYSFFMHDIDHVSEQEIDGNMCTGFAIRQNVTGLGQWTIWVDNQSYDIRAFRKSGSLPISAFQSEERITKDDVQDNADTLIQVPPDIFKGMVYWSMRIEFTNIVFNESIASEDFFRPE